MNTSKENAPERSAVAIYRKCIACDEETRNETKDYALIEEEIIRLAKRRAAEQGRALGDLIQDALVQYLRKHTATPGQRNVAYHVFCERPMNIPPEELRHVLEEDI